MKPLEDVLITTPSHTTLPVGTREMEMSSRAWMADAIINAEAYW